MKNLRNRKKAIRRLREIANNRRNGEMSLDQFLADIITLTARYNLPPNGLGDKFENEVENYAIDLDGIDGDERYAGNRLYQHITVKEEEELILDNIDKYFPDEKK